jgi:Tfp pilus assembly pilus retraction ATPase PilT
MVMCQRLLPRKKGGLWPAREVMFMNAAIGNLIRSGGEKQINTYLLSGIADGMMEWNKCLQIASSSNIISAAIATSYEENGDTI